MKLWFDDERPPPGKVWLWATTVEEAKDVFMDFRVTIASLDHDLGVLQKPAEKKEFTLAQYLARSSPTKGVDGMDLVRFMIEQDRYPQEALYIHSWNPIGAENMRAALANSRCPCPIIVAPYRPVGRIKPNASQNGS